MAAPNAQPDSPQPDDAPDPGPDEGPRDEGGRSLPDDPGPQEVPAPEDGPHDAPREPALDVDAQWAGIVAELGDLSGLDRGTEGERGGREDAGGTGETPAAPGRPADPGRGPRDVLGSVPVAPWVRASGPRDWPTTPEVEDLEEAESHFVPPDPPLVLGRDPLLTMAWALVVGVPLLLLVVLVVVRPYPVIVAQVGGAAFLVGLAILLWRMPHRRDDDDEGPGAVV
ncbi:hypothetical protein [Cellulosimicrobium protaetiae]|uniref:Uncharacterized protein n=1 Tax=Cellulosimicrobium protaetiae TaxID=2587808 RepID=A0A6M5UIR3_9MICO|nr:hypothetical protein [Cellulosimicrobium protaetiae]QJW36559.1 hypothetical protein FIC82_010500 [Cellulosimicrobium protaetiae]